MSTSRYEWCPYKGEELDEFYINKFPSAYYIGPSTMRYNCFSYAFYQQSTANKYNMAESVSNFWDDGSYVRVSSPKTGDIALYWDYDLDAYRHAGIVTSISPEVWVCSKWGSTPLMEHPVLECPYEEMGVHYYRLYTKL